MATEQSKMQDANVSRISVISQQIREALRKALPAPPEQFFHVMVPGKVVNFADYTEGFNEEGVMITPILPSVTELNQARLCDDMPVLAPVQLGPTGRSVSRSYAATISKLVPSATTVGVESLDPSVLSDAEKRYQRAMDWLLAEDDRNPGKSHLDTYIIKQRLYTDAEERKIKRFSEAYDRCLADPINKTNALKRAAYDKWVNENARKLRNEVEGAYKDWVIHGRKEAVEYWFAVVDNDSAMARVEQSKEAMRNSVVMNDDGSVEYPKVVLTPSNWARIAQKKMKSGTDQTRTAAQISWEIVHLQKKARMIDTMIKNPPSLKGADGNEPAVPSDDKADSALGEATKEYLAKVTARDNLRRKTDANKDDIKKADDEVKVAKEGLDKALKEFDKGSVDRLSAMSLVELNKLYQGPKEGLKNTLTETEQKIDALKEEMATLMGKSATEDALLKGILPEDAKPPAPSGSDEVDYFTPISVEISSSSASSKTTEYSAQTAKNSSSRYGWWWGGSSSSSSSSDSSSADAQSQMMNADVKVSFECMRVDIDRPWMRPELFYDDDLRAAPGAFISPGPMRLAALMDPDNSPINIPGDVREQELERFGTFPLYPTAFLLACNVVLEISGETAAIQRHFDESSSSSSSKSNSWWFGPINSESSSSHEKNESATCETTSNGCRITIKSPQIIGWVSQMVPTLPRKSNPNVPVAPSSGPSTFSVDSGSEPQVPAAPPAPKSAPGGVPTPKK